MDFFDSFILSIAHVIPYGVLHVFNHVCASANCSKPKTCFHFIQKSNKTILCKNLRETTTNDEA